MKDPRGFAPAGDLPDPSPAFAPGRGRLGRHPSAELAAGAVIAVRSGCRAVLNGCRSVQQAGWIDPKRVSHRAMRLSDRAERVSHVQLACCADAEPLSHCAVSLSHRAVSLSHRPASLSHRPASLSHRPVSLSHRPASLSHRPVSLSHRPVSLSHRPVSLSHRPVSLSHRAKRTRPTGSHT